jgi:3-hydroxy acid dehydrogenase / malonic semialdehyde reductase
MAETPTSLRGKRVLISGGTTGIGRATALALAAEGAKVFIYGRDEAALKDALADIDAKGAVDGIAADQADKKDLARIFAAADAFLGGLDILVNNAGIGGDELAKQSDAEWRYVLATNLTGYIACAKQALTLMRKSGGGHIVQIGSISADRRGGDDPIYVTTKAAIQGFSAALRKEAASHNVRVSLIEPGSVGTDMNENPPAEQRKEIARKALLKAEDVAEAVRFALVQPPRSVVTVMQIEPLLQD